MSGGEINQSLGIKYEHKHDQYSRGRNPLPAFRPGFQKPFLGSANEQLEESGDKAQTAKNSNQVMREAAPIQIAGCRTIAMASAVSVMKMARATVSCERIRYTCSILEGISRYLRKARNSDNSAVNIPTMTPYDPTASYGSSPNGITSRKAGLCLACINDHQKKTARAKTIMALRFRTVGMLASSTRSRTSNGDLSPVNLFERMAHPSPVQRGLWGTRTFDESSPCARAKGSIRPKSARPRR
jgi:hypothetical protein